MKQNRMINFKIIYVKILIKIYSIFRNILPNKMMKLKKYIEKISLNNTKEIYNIISKNINN